MTEREQPEQREAAAPSIPPAPAGPEAAQVAAAGTVGLVDIDTFRQIDLRVAEIVAAEPVEKAARLLRLQIDLGGERRQLVAGIAAYYSPEDLIGRKIIVVANLAPARIRGVESQGMLLAAGGRATDASLGLLSVDPAIPNGTRVE